MFLALWPPAAVREQLVELQRKLHWPDGAKPTAPGKLHLTLHFIGAVPRDRTGELRSGLAVAFTPFDLVLESLASFQHGRSAVLLAREIPDGLLALHAVLAARLWPQDPGPRRCAPWLLYGGLYYALFGTMLMFDLLMSVCVLLGLTGLAGAWRSGGRRRDWLLYALGLGLGDHHAVALVLPRADLLAARVAPL